MFGGLLWTKCVCVSPPTIHMLRPGLPMSLCLEMGPLRKYLKLSEVIRVGPWPSMFSVLKTETPESSLSLSFHARARRKSRLSTEQDGGCLKARKRASTRNRIFWHFDRGVLASRMWKNSFTVVCCWSYSVCSVLLWQPGQTKTGTENQFEKLEHVGGIGDRELCFRMLTLSLERRTPDVSTYKSLLLGW